MAEETTVSGQGLRRYGSPEEAFTDLRTPRENRAFIRSMLFRLPVEGLFRSGDHILAIRSDGGQPVRVHEGYSVGFASEEDLIALVGQAPRWVSARHPGLWAVDHPKHDGQREAPPVVAAAKKGAGRGGRAPAAPKEPKAPKAQPQPERVQPVCPNCFLLMALSGICGNCAE